MMVVKAFSAPLFVTLPSAIARLTLLDRLDGHGMWMVKGDFETLERLWMTDEAQHMLIKGRWLLEDFGYEFVRTGDAADQYMTFFADIGKELAFS